MIATRRKIYTDKILDNLLDAQKNMASAEKVDAKGLVYLSRFILRLLKQLHALCVMTLRSLPARSRLHIAGHALPTASA